MSEESSIKDLVDILKRIEARLVSAVHVKLGLIYLKWTIAMVGFTLANLLLDILKAPSITYLIVALIYWLIAIYLIVFRGRPGYSRTLNTYVRMYFREKGIEDEALRRYRILYFLGWILASIVGFALVPLILGMEYWVSGYPLFLGIGILVSYMGMEHYLKVYDRGFIVFSVLLILSSLLSAYMVGIDWSLAFYFTITASALVFLLIGTRYILMALR